MITLHERRNPCNHERVYDIYLNNMYGGFISWNYITHEWVSIEFNDYVVWSSTNLQLLSQKLKELNDPITNDMDESNNILDISQTG